MQKRRVRGEPWYTALYREPHTFWWAPAVLVFLVVFSIDRFGFDASLAETSAYAAIIAAANAVIGYFRWRGERG